MSTDKSSKWSSSSSLSKLVSRITRTLSFTSKKSQQTFKTNTKKVKPTETIVKNVNYIPQSVPIIRRHPPVLISKEHVYRQNMYVEEQQEEETDDEHYRYSLRPNLSLFNVSLENINDYPPLQPDWLDEIFHSTKIEEK
ncbi:hypothetical protein I4U23_027943 [Adineta vaga]|nr:hypothetical protein I4U23_027943 [Adineta vaga]